MRFANPYASVDWSRAVRGNLHSHSRQSDGAAEPQAVIDAYAAKDFGYLMFSDHDVHTEAEQLARWDAKGLTLIPGCEVSAHGPHLLQVGGAARAEPREDRQAVIDAIVAGGGLAVLNHPNWFADHDHWKQEQLLALERYAGIEIYNHVITELPGSPYATDRWDRLLGRGRRIWGFANDDSHALGHVGFAWNTAFPDAPGAAGVCAALQAGRFYASTGVTIDRITVDGNRIAIAARDAERIVAVLDWGKRGTVVDGQELVYEVPETVSYVRFECYGSRDRRAWSQPIFVEKA